MAFFVQKEKTLAATTATITSAMRLLQWIAKLEWMRNGGISQVTAGVLDHLYEVVVVFVHNASATAGKNDCFRNAWLLPRLIGMKRDSCINFRSPVRSFILLQGPGVFELIFSRYFLLGYILERFFCLEYSLANAFFSECNFDWFTRSRSCRIFCCCWPTRSFCLSSFSTLSSPLHN